MASTINSFGQRTIVSPPSSNGHHANGRKHKARPITAAIARKMLARIVQPEPADVPEMVEWMRRDYQVRLAELVLTTGIKAIPVTFTVTGGDQRTQALANALQRLWRAHFATMLEVIAYGRVAFETLWRYDEGQNLLLPVGLDDLPFDDSELILDKDTGDEVGVRLKIGDTECVFTTAKSWWLAIDTTTTRRHGRSRFAGAPYEVWRERQESIRLRGVYMTRFVLDGGVAHVPDKAELEDGTTIDCKSATAQAHDERLAGGLLIFSNERDAQGNYVYDVTQPGQLGDPASINTHIDGLDQDQLQAFGIPPKTVLEGGEVGSFAMVGIQRLVLDAVLDDLIGQIAKSFQHRVVNVAHALNGCPGTITVSHPPLLDGDSVSRAVAEKLIDNPDILMSGAVDLPAVLKASGVRLTPDATDRLSQLVELYAEQPSEPQDAIKQLLSGGQGAASTEGQLANWPDDLGDDADDEDAAGDAVDLAGKGRRLLGQLLKRRWKGGGKGSNQYGSKGVGKGPRKKTTSDKYAIRQAVTTPPGFAQAKNVKGRIVIAGKTPDHLKAYRIPPAWTNVVASTAPKSALIAKGYDKKGRLQSLYSNEHSMRQGAIKFNRVKSLIKRQDEFRDRFVKDMRNAPTREPATVMALIQHTGIRPGSARNTLADVKAFGATTLQSRHVIDKGDRIILAFVGKKGVNLRIPVTDKTLMKELRLRAKKSGPLFATSDAELRQYTKAVTGRFKPKDFRTARGTSIAMSVVKKTPPPTNEREYKLKVRAVATEVSKALGNTPTIALQSYINPAVFANWRIN
jgi:DNA topoisomerase-1